MSFKDKLLICFAVIVGTVMVLSAINLDNKKYKDNLIWEQHVGKGLSARIEKECKDYLKMMEYGMQYTHSFEYNFGAGNVPKIENYCMSKYGSGIWI